MVVGIVEHTVDVKNHVSDVLLALAVIRHEELVRGVDGEVHGWLGCRGRHHLDIIITLLLGGLLCSGLPWRGLELGRHDGAVDVVGGSIVVSDIGVVDGSVDLVALFTVDLFVLNTCVATKARCVRGHAHE